MKKNLVLGLAGVAALVAFTGCANMEVTSGQQLNGQKLSQSGTTVAHFTASNSGLYLLSIPLLSGSTVNPGKMVFNEDTVNANQVISMVTKESGKLGASQTIDVVSAQQSNIIWIPIPFLFNMRTVHVSATGVK